MCQSLLTGWSKEEKGVGQSEITRARLALGSFSPKLRSSSQVCAGVTVHALLPWQPL